MSNSKTIWSARTEFQTLNQKQVDYLNENNTFCHLCGKPIEAGKKVQLVIFHNKDFTVRHYECRII